MTINISILFCFPGSHPYLVQWRSCQVAYVYTSHQILWSQRTNSSVSGFQKKIPPQRNLINYRLIMPPEQRSEAIAWTVMISSSDAAAVSSCLKLLFFLSEVLLFICLLLFKDLLWIKQVAGDRYSYVGALAIKLYSN